MAAFGFAWEQVTVAEIEGKRQRRVSIEEWLGLAAIFGGTATELLLPPGGEDVVLTPSEIEFDQAGLLAMIGAPSDVAGKTFREVHLRMDRARIQDQLRDAENAARSAGLEAEALRTELERVESELANPSKRATRKRAQARGPSPRKRSER